MAILFDPIVLQDQARDELLADPVFANIPVVSADPGDIDTAITFALSKLGIGCLVLVPNMRRSNKNQPGPYFDGIRMTVEVIENPTLNRSAANPNYITATQLAMIVAADLDWYAPAGISERFYVTDVVSMPDPKKVFNIFHIELTGGGGIGYDIPNVAPVVAAPATPSSFPQLVTLSCATPGASIWYTLDGSYPSPRNSSANLVLLLTAGVLLNDETGLPILNDQTGAPILTTGPINIPVMVQPGQKLSARAWLNGYRPTTPDQQVTQY